MEAELHLSFEDAVHGVHHLGQRPERRALLDLPRHGRRAGHRHPHLPALRGTGSLDDNQGLFSLSTVCPDCTGRGTLVDTPCPTVPGHRHRAEGPLRSRSGSLPGVEDGQRIRVKGRGAPGQGMAPPGDLYVVVHVVEALDVRPERTEPDPQRAGHLPGGRARAPRSPCPHSTGRSP